MPSASQTAIDAAAGFTDVNIKPNVAFTVSASNLTVTTNSTSDDPDGTIVNYLWGWGDGGSNTPTSVPTASYTYAAAGTYTIVLTVTDNDGANSTTSNDVTVTAPTNGYTNDTGVNPSSNGAEPTGASLVSYSGLSGTFYQREQSVGATNQMSLPVNTMTLPGFTSDIYATAVTNCGGLIGAGSARSLITIGANTSASNAAAYSNLLRFNNDNVVLQDFQLQGAYQSTAPYYAGIMIKGDDPTVNRVKLVSADPGSQAYPPGETFGINLYSGSGATLTDVEIDASAKGSQNAGASLFGTNSWTGTTNFTRCYAHDGNYSAGWALWQTNGTVNLTDCVVDQCRCYWNIERCAGTVTILRPRIGTLQAATSGWDSGGSQSAHGIVAESDATWGASISQSFRFVVRDPRNLDGTPYSGPKVVVQFISAHDGGTQYYGSNNFEAYNASGTSIKSSFYTFSSGGFN